MGPNGRRPIFKGSRTLAGRDQLQLEASCRCRSILCRTSNRRNTWEWGQAGYSLLHGSGNLSHDPEQAAPGHDGSASVLLAGIRSRSKAMEPCGAWGDNSMNQSGNGPSPTQTGLVQVGTDHDWAAASCQGTYTVGLRTNGTLWVWGQVYSFGSGQPIVNKVAVPTQVCRETNWVGLSTGFGVMAWTRSGESRTLTAPPDPEAAAVSNCRLILSNSVPDQIASALRPTKDVPSAFRRYALGNQLRFRIRATHPRINGGGLGTAQTGFQSGVIGAPRWD